MYNLPDYTVHAVHTVTLH